MEHKAATRGGSRKKILPHFPGTPLDRELRSAHRHCTARHSVAPDTPLSSQTPAQQPTLQVYLPYFVTDNFETSQRLELVLQHRTLQQVAGLDPAMQARVATCMLGNGDFNGENGEFDGAIYVVFVTVTHWILLGRGAKESFAPPPSNPHCVLR